jgi:enamine deaminase RidA (YjgF/YER057c/UK114 family)
MAEDLLVPGDGVLIKQPLLVAVALTGPLTASAQERKQIPLPPAQGVLPNMPGAVGPGNLLFVSGWLDPDLETHTDVKSQTVGALKSLQTFLESQELTLGDAVMMHAYIGSEAGRDGYSAGYAEFFGPDQSNKPAHSLLQVVLPGARRGALVEIDLIAVCPTSPAHD